MDPADARAWLENGLRYEKYARRSPECHYAAPIMKWMVARLPEVALHTKPDWDDEAITELLDEFFASPSGTPFPSDDYRDMLRELCESGCGDPLRWSGFRISNILRNPIVMNTSRWRSLWMRRPCCALTYHSRTPVAGSGRA